MNSNHGPSKGKVTELEVMLDEYFNLGLDEYGVPQMKIRRTFFK